MIDISEMLHTIQNENEEPILKNNDTCTNEDDLESAMEYSTSFMVNLPNKRCELQVIKESLQIENENDTPINWPNISSNPINEYTIEGFFDMAFPTLFPNSKALPMQPRAREVHLHEYALHLMRYHDNRFGHHPHFRYFLLNLMMRHCSQATTSIFIKRKVEENIPTTIEHLSTHLHSLPNKQLAEELIHFGYAMRGTRAYWKKCRCDLTSMINQIGSPTLIFKLSAADTKWPTLHTMFPANHASTIVSNRDRIDNVIKNPHTTSLYLQHYFTIFREEVIEKLLHATNYWYRYEWQHRGSAHVHGFLWLENAPDMDTLDWGDNLQVARAK